MDSRIGNVNRTIFGLLNGSVVPTRIYLFISEEGFLLDKGIPPTKIPHSLFELSQHFNFSVVYTDNIGPHRKLLPLLAKKWDEDCIIITLDDEPEKEGGKTDWRVEQLLKYHKASGEDAVVSLRTRRIGQCDTPPWRTLPYNAWRLIYTSADRELLLLPTGTGGVLYRPRFFHPVVFDEKFREITKTADDLHFRLSTLLNGVPVVTGCHHTSRVHCPPNIRAIASRSYLEAFLIAARRRFNDSTR
jgi:hypothetical protein